MKDLYDLPWDDQNSSYTRTWNICGKKIVLEANSCWYRYDAKDNFVSCTGCAIEVYADEPYNQNRYYKGVLHAPYGGFGSKAKTYSKKFPKANGYIGQIINFLYFLERQSFLKSYRIDSSAVADFVLSAVRSYFNTKFFEKFADVLIKMLRPITPEMIEKIKIEADEHNRYCRTLHPASYLKGLLRPGLRYLAWGEWDESQRTN